MRPLPLQGVFGRRVERHQPTLVAFEAFTLSGWVHDLCGELGLPCKVANTASEAWKFKHVKRKTDKDDALRLAQLEAPGQLPTHRHDQCWYRQSAAATFRGGLRDTVLLTGRDRSNSLP
jgi:transposase